MSDKPITEVEEFGHLGLVAAIFKDYGLTDKIDKLLPKLSNWKRRFPLGAFWPIGQSSGDRYCRFGMGPLAI